MNHRLTAEVVLARVQSLPPLPRVWHELDAALRDDASGSERIVRIMSQDQAMTAVALKLANSPFYGLSGRAVSLRDAVQILGMRTLSAVTTTAAVMSRFNARACPGYDLEGNWRHALATALCAQTLAESRKVDPCLAYTAGLLHDIGSLALATYFGEAFAATLAWSAAHEVPPMEAEQALLGIDHAQVGGLLATHWRLAPPVIEAIRLHHDTAAAAPSPLVDVLHLADNIVHALDIARASDDLVPPLSLDAWGRLAPAPEELQRMFEYLDARLTKLDLGLYA